MRTILYRGQTYTVSDAHPAADALPWHLDTDEFAELVESVRTHGFDPDRPVVRCARTGRVIGGRRRELACRVAGVEPVHRNVDWADEEVVAWVRREDLHRRNLTAAERVAAELALDGVLHRLAGVGANQHTAGEIAKRAGVSRKTVQRVKKAARHPALAAAVRDGRVSAKPAAELAELPAAEVDDVLASDDVAAAAAEAVHLHRWERQCERLRSDQGLLDATLRRKLSPTEFERALSLPLSYRVAVAADDEPIDLAEYKRMWRATHDHIRERAPEVAEALTAGVLDQDAAITAACLSPAHRAEVLAAAHPPTALREVVDRHRTAGKPATALRDWHDHPGGPVDLDRVADLIPGEVWEGRAWGAFQELPEGVLVAYIHPCASSVGEPGSEWFVSLMDMRLKFGSRTPMKREFVAVLLHMWGLDLRATRWHLTDDPPAEVNPPLRRPLYDDGPHKPTSEPGR
jgi:hypothetical protein